MVSLRKAAKIYTVSTYTTLRRRIGSGDLPAVKLGYKLIRVRIEDLDKLLPAIPTDDPRIATAGGENHPRRCSKTTGCSSILNTWAF